MHLKKSLLLLLLLSFSLSFTQAIEIPFHRGFNLTWIWSNESANKISFSKYGKEDLENIKEMGCDVIRLPLSLRYFADNTLDRTLNPIFFYFLDQVVDWCEELELYLILDNHTQFPNSSYVPTLKDLIPIWRQVAERYSDRSEYILYETFNEPHNISNSSWEALQKYVIRTIRSVDSTHTIIVKPVWDSPSNYKNFKPVDDENVIYSFHSYRPFLFTHQGASWANPPLVNLAGVPYPASAGEMPDCPEDLIGTHFEAKISNYYLDGTDSAVYAYNQPVYDFAEKHNVAIMCDEFGTYSRNAPEADRHRWHKMIIDHFEERDIPWTLWGYNGSFGITKANSYHALNYDIDSVMVNNLRLNMPEQDTSRVCPDTTGFMLYHDYTPRHIIPHVYMDENRFNLYSKTDPAQGEHCIKLTKADAYESINVRFDLLRDISILAQKGASLKFSIKGNQSGTIIYARFMNNNLDNPDEPRWRKVYQLNDHNMTWDNQWHEVSLPLERFYEIGFSKDGERIEPQDKFKWSNIYVIGFYGTGDKLCNATLYFDNIRIELPGEELATSDIIPDNFELHPIYPNPFNAQSTISFSLSEAKDVKIDIYNIQGKIIENITSEYYQAGNYQLKWNANNLSSGVYLVRMQYGDKIICKKAGLIK